MEQCTYCRRRQFDNKLIVHEIGCPQVCPGNKAIYNRGWDDGRAGKPRASTDLAYQMGYVRGEVSAEEADNGFQSWGY